MTYYLIILHKGSKLDKSILEEMTSLETMVNKIKTYHDKTPMMYDYMTDTMESILMYHNYSIADSDHEMTSQVWNF
jgi:hypothetical protein